MLIARNAQGNLVNVLEGIEKEEAYYCPACSGALVLKAGQVMRRHFAHRSKRDCHFFHENESAEHLNLKSQLYTSLSQTEQVDIEKVLPELNQVADLMVNQTLALEVQCSPLSIERLYERTQAYQRANYQVLWLLGKKLWLKERLSSLQGQFLYFSQNMGFYLWELDDEQSLLRLKYLIYEDIEGHVHYLQKEFPFSADLMAAFRSPYLAQSMTFYRRKSNLKVHDWIQRQLVAKNTRWLALQEEAYLQGENLLTKPLDSFYPQYRPPKAARGFCQISQDLTSFYQAFEQFYRKTSDKSSQVLYPPRYYVRIKSS